MIVEACILAGIFGTGYKKFVEQKNKYTKKLLDKQQQETQYLQTVKNAQTNTTEIILNTQPKSSMARTPTDLIYLSGAIFLSTIGLWIYHPLVYFAAPFILYASRRRVFAAWMQLKQGRFDVEGISSLGIIGALIGQRFLMASLAASIGTIGNYLSSKIINDTQHQLLDVFKDMPDSVWLLKDGTEILVPLADTQTGDTLVISAGEIIPADGKIIWGAAGVDEHQFTGESMLAEKGEGDEVFAMTLVVSGKIHFVIEKAGSASSAMQIADILNHTADYKSSTVLEAEALSRQLVKPALLASGLTWPIFGFSAAVGMLFAHPKERLQVSAPISLVNYLKQSMEEGILIKDGRSLELLYKVDTIVFDKTGTLTEDKPHIGDIHAFVEHDENSVLHYAAIAEYKQTHPLAQAVLTEARQRGLAILEPAHSECRLGYGMKVTHDAMTIHVGSIRFMNSESIIAPEAAARLQEECRMLGHGLIMVALNGQLIGALELLPTIRPEAKAAIHALKQLKQIKKTYIISGDHEAPTRRLAEELGIDHYFAQTLPQQKAELIEQLQQQGDFVCFIGDGINDAIAMKQAQVSISLSGASQLATDTAQILLLDKGISHLPRLFELAKSFNRHMENQLSMILGSSIVGVSMIILKGWGMSSMMALNMAALTATLGYSMIDRPKKKPAKTKASVCLDTDKS